MFITAIDTETTGLDLKKHEIIQLGIMKYKLEENGDLKLIDRIYRKKTVLVEKPIFHKNLNY